MKTKRKIPASMSAAAILLCLILLSAHYTTGMYARYTTRAAGDDKSRAAAFRVSAKADSTDPVSIEPLGNGNYQVTVRNDSEVAVRYVARVTSSDPAAKELFKNISLSGELAPKESKALSVELDMKTYSGEETEIPFNVIVTFTQID